MSRYSYPEAELEACLRRAVKNGLKTLCIYSRNERFLLETTTLGVDKGWLTEGVIVDDDSQSSRGEWTFTEAGLAHLGS